MAIDKKELKEYILKVGDEAREANRTRFKNLDEWDKRFQALRSVFSLDEDIKRRPWVGASNVGIPIDATVVYTIASRLMRARYGVDPGIIMKPADLPYTPDLQRFINWEIDSEMKMFMDYLLIIQGMLIDGDRIIKTLLDKDEIYFDDDVIYYLNEAGEPYLSESTSAPLEANSLDDKPVFDPLTLQTFNPTKAQATRNRVIYHGPRAITVPLKHFLVPQDADSPEINGLSWCIHEYWKPYGWVHQQAEEHPELFDKEAVRRLKKDKDKSREIEEDKKQEVLGIQLKTKTKNFKFWEWHGRYEDDKGREHELVALLTPDEKELIGFIPNRFFYKTKTRQFVHYTAFPQDGRFYSKGVPEWLRGIRSMLDGMINSGFDRSALYDNPPLLYDNRLSDFDPSQHKFGPGQPWGLKDITRVAFLRTPQNESQVLIREEMLFDIIQKLFGVTDYALGSATTKGKANKGDATASGVMSIINEGNIRFDMIIKLVQEWSNPELARQIFKHVVLNLPDIMETKGLNKPKEIFDPILEIPQDELMHDFEYEFKGNTSTINPVVEQQQATFLLQMAMKLRIPFVVDDPDVVHDLTEYWLNTYNLRGIKIKSVDEFRKMSATEPDKAKQIKEQAVREQMQLPQGGGGMGPNLIQAQPAMARAR